MPDKIAHLTVSVTELAREAGSSPNFAAFLSGYILSIHWLVFLSEAFKYISSALAFLALLLLIGNHLLARKNNILTEKKLKLEIEALQKTEEKETK